MNQATIPATELRAGDHIWTRTWYAAGDQPVEVNGWREVVAVRIATRATITLVDLPGGPSVVFRYPDDQVQVRRPSPESA